MASAMQRDGTRALQAAARMVIVAIVVAALYWAQVVLIPLALAALVTFLMSPLVTRLDRVGLPRVLAVIIVAGSVTGLLGGLGYMVVDQLTEFADELPEYRDNIRQKLADLRAMTRGGTLERVQTTIRDISEDVESDVAAEEGEAAGGAGGGEREASEPMRVRIEPDDSLIGNAGVLSPVAQVAATAGLTMLLSIFMLIKREDLRNRLVSLAGHTSLPVTTKAFAEAGERISRYLLMQFIINATMGLAVGLGLFLIGVPYAALWGLSAAVLRYVPYVGPWIAALLPISVSWITAPGWEQVVLVVGMFVTLELLSNNVMEPWLYGSSVGLSAIAVIVSVIFWTWIWGPVGLVLATPLTVCLVVLARHIPGLALIDRLLSEGPALQPHLSLYQRLLAHDEEEAEDIIEEYRADHSLAETCDELLLGTLLALKRDVSAGRIAAAEGDLVASALEEIIDDLRPAADSKESPEQPGVLLMGFPVRDRYDEIALQLLDAMLREENGALEVLSSEMLIGERVAEVATRKPAAVCVATLPPGDLTATRHACKRLRARVPGLTMIVGRLGRAKARTRSSELLTLAGARHVAFSLAEIRALLRPVLRDGQRTDAIENGDRDPALSAIH